MNSVVKNKIGFASLLVILISPILVFAQNSASGDE